MRVIPVGLALLFACARPAALLPDPAASGPVITRLDPASGPPGSRITIIGRGFTDTGNVVKFGRVALAPVSSDSAGTRLVFSVPLEEPSTGEVPPRPITVGTYDVTVTTTAGTSSPIPFSVTSR